MTGFFRSVATVGRIFVALHFSAISHTTAVKRVLGAAITWWSCTSAAGLPVPGMQLSPVQVHIARQ